MWVWLVDRYRLEVVLEHVPSLYPCPHTFFTSQSSLHSLKFKKIFLLLYIYIYIYIYIYVITPSRGMLLVYNPDSRGHMAPEWGGIINHNIPTGRCCSWFIPCVARWFGATIRHQYCFIQPISISLYKRYGWHTCSCESRYRYNHLVNIIVI